MKTRILLGLIAMLAILLLIGFWLLSPVNFIMDEDRVIYHKGPLVYTFYEEAIDMTYDETFGVLAIIEAKRSEATDVVNSEYAEALARGYVPGGYLSLYQVGDIKISQIIREDLTPVNPWTLDLGDIEGDGELDIFVGAFRATDFYPMDPRPYMISYNGRYLYRKWTGSMIGYDIFYGGHFQWDDEKKQSLLVLDRRDEEGHSYEETYIYFDFYWYPLMDNIENDY